MSTDSESATKQITRLLQRWSTGDDEAVPGLMEAVHGELAWLAQRHMMRERRGHTLETGALVNEAWMRLAEQGPIDWESRKHFYGIAARTMRRILVEHARKRDNLKRGGNVQKVALDDVVVVGIERPEELVALDDALQALADTDPSLAELVELRFFAGLTHTEIAELRDVSLSTIDRQWKLAKAWLYETLRA